MVLPGFVGNLKQILDQIVFSFRCATCETCLQAKTWAVSVCFAFLMLPSTHLCLLACRSRP